MSTAPPGCGAPLRPPAHILLALLRAESSATVSSAIACPPELWPAVLHLADRHGVAPLLDRALAAREIEVPEAIRAQVRELRRETALANLRKFGEFRRIARALGERAIPMIPLKGLHLAELVYRDISLRPMVDMDVLVPRQHVATALQALREAGYGHDADVSPAVTSLLDVRCNAGLEHGRLGLWLEVHWSIDEPPACYQEIVEEIWRSATPARIGDAPVAAMRPELLLLHVAAHLACNHAFAFSLRALCDLAEIVRRHSEMDWSIVVDHGRRHGWHRGVPAALALAKRHLGADIPDRVLEELGAAALDAVLLEEAMAHLVASIEMPASLLTAPNLIGAATARAPLASAVALWRRVFVSRGELALLYGIPQRSPRLLVYYAVRIRDLVVRYAGAARALVAGDPGVRDEAARHARLASWVRGA